ncbi:PhaM family polyhydroxyalkanoate granule multifunctional regulatory protein [Cupriavidus campinensis]
MFGQIPDFTNGFEFLRKLWSSGSGMPSGLMPGLGAMTPPMDLDEVDKRIHDLKAVEGWLQLNASLLRTTIQGLEVQRATLVALQTFGNALSPETMQSAMENVARAANAPSATPPHHHRPEPAETLSEAEADAANAEAEDDDAPPDDGASAEATASASSAGAAPLPPNAALWWDLVQQQFNQIASSAAAASVAPFGNLAGFGAMGAPGAAPDLEPDAKPGKAGPKPKPAARKAAAGKTAAKKSTVKKAAVKKPAAKQAAAKTATVKKPAPRAAPRRAAATPATPASPGTPEDTFE